MRPLIIEIKDDKAIRILQSLKDTNLIDFSDEKENITLKELLKLKPKNTSKNISFFELEGIWKDRDITIETLREKAWPKRT